VTHLNLSSYLSIIEIMEGGHLEEIIDLLMLDVNSFLFSTNTLAPLDSILFRTKFESNFQWKLQISSISSACCYYLDRLLLSSKSKHYSSFCLSSINTKQHQWTLFFLWVLSGTNQVFLNQDLKDLLVV
jgi:hypothetical protein